MNIIFMGTPDFAVPCLNALIESGETVSAVFTQPDKPKGRGYKLTPPPVKEIALTHNIPIYQPISLKKGEDGENALKVIRDISPDLIIVVAYGKLLPKEILDAPKYYCINVHASLLPKYRGAAPIQWSVLNGEKETGVTTMLMAEGLDTGDMLLSRSVEIGENETASELHDRLAKLGSKVLIDTLDAVKSKSLTPISQDDKSCYAPMLTKDMCPIDFTRSAREVHNHIRGLSSSPCATAVLDGKRIKVFKSELVKGLYSDLAAGTVVKSKDFTIACGDGNCVRFTEVQAEGGKRMSAADYLRGKAIKEGTVLE